MTPSFFGTGEEQPARGDADAAIDYLQKAANAAPDWPYPLYDEAFSYLLHEDYGRAFELYKRVDELAPRGFFTVKTAVDTLRKEEAGELPEGTYLSYVSLEWVKDPGEKEQVLDALAAQIPGFAPIWKEKALLTSDAEQCLTCLENGLASDPDATTKGFLLLNKALILSRRGKKKDAIDLLGELALDPFYPVNVEQLAKSTLSTIIEPTIR